VDAEGLGDLVIHSVHGTFPYGASKQRKLGAQGHNPSLYSPGNVPWFLPESDFAKEILNRCPARWSAFTWSGKNSFAARREAIDSFYGQLKGSLEELNTRHVIIAHSHGGTVVAAALCKLEEMELDRIEGVVTLGAPFITLKDREWSAFSRVQFFFARLGPFIALLYAAAFGGTWWLPGDPSLTARFVAALPLLLILLIIAFFLSNGSERFFNFVFRPAVGAGAYFDIFRSDYPLKRTLIALRAPGDEAGLVIGSAQLFGWFMGVVWKISVQLSVARIGAWLAWSTANALRSIAAIFCFLLAIAGAMWFLDAIPQIDPLQIPGARAISIGLGIMGGFMLFSGYLILFLLVLLMFTELLIFPAVILLRCATGPEIWRVAGLAEVECEPVPSGMRAVVETVEFAAEDRVAFEKPGKLRHSFHELASVRRRVADLILEWTTPQTPMQDIKEGGRACELLFDIWELEHGATLAAGGGPAVALFGELHDRVLKAERESADFAFRRRFLPLLPPKARNDVEPRLITADCDALQRRIARHSAPLSRP
jgi:hypothetical protein